jgi:REP element-mobilizing transposase RayT
MNRGVARRPIFQDRTDRRIFLQLVAQQVSAGRLAFHAYSLLDNHYHMLVEVPTGELDVAMREIGRRYSRAYNRARDRDGPLFRSRFRSQLVADELYRRNVLEYIDRNAVAAALASHPSDYEWGSAAQFALDPSARPNWLCTTWVSQVVYYETSVAGLPKDAYRALFRGFDDLSTAELVEARLQVSAIFDPRARWSTLGFEARERFIQDWLSSRANLADGPGDWLPLAAARTVQRVVAATRQLQGAWTRPGKGAPLDLWAVAEAGLLLHLAALATLDGAALVGVEPSAFRKRLRRHNELFATNQEYAATLAALAHCILGRPDPTPSTRAALVPS